MGYVDFEYYKFLYNGLIDDVDEFTRYEMRSRMEIDRYTFNRVRKAVRDMPDFEVPEEVKNAQCMMIDFMKTVDDNGGKIIASESVSKHSVTYAGAKSFDEEVRDIVKRCLGGTPWTYMGGGFYGERKPHHVV